MALLVFISDGGRFAVTIEPDRALAKGAAGRLAIEEFLPKYHTIWGEIPRTQSLILARLALGIFFSKQGKELSLKSLPILRPGRQVRLREAQRCYVLANWDGVAIYDTLRRG